MRINQLFLTSLILLISFFLYFILTQEIPERLRKNILCFLKDIVDRLQDIEGQEPSDWPTVTKRKFILTMFSIPAIHISSIPLSNRNSSIPEARYVVDSTNM